MSDESGAEYFQSLPDDDLDTLFWFSDMLRPEDIDLLSAEYDRRKRPYPIEVRSS